MPPGEIGPMRTTSTPRTVVVGGGLVGLATAFRLAERGFPVTLVNAPRPGVASGAAAGMLAPSTERPATPAAEAAHRFAVRSRDRYPAFVGRVADRSGLWIPLERNGILEVAVDEADLTRLAALGGPHAEWLEAAQVHALEPALGAVAGALFHSGDGVVDNPALVRALRLALETMESVTVLREEVVAVVPPEGDAPARVRLANADVVDGEFLVLAAGAWVGRVAGVPRSLPVEPVRGQMLAWRGRRIRHVVYGAGGYVVPREAETLAGSTMERVGFDAATTGEGLAEVRGIGVRLLPALAEAEPDRSWAGLRPVTPDLLPLIGADPEHPRLLYACGHSRNGVLLAPLTADCLVALVAGEEPPGDLAPFAPGRFGALAVRAG